MNKVVQYDDNGFMWYELYFNDNTLLYKEYDKNIVYISCDKNYSEYYLSYSNKKFIINI